MKARTLHRRKRPYARRSIRACASAISGISGVGDLKDQAGFAELVTPYKRTVDRQANYAYAIFITPTDQGLYLNAYVYSTNIGAARVLGRWDALQVKP